MTKDERKKIIKSKLAKHNITQVDIANDLGISKVFVYLWVKGKKKSINVENWFKNKFGEKFINEIKKAA